MSVYYAACIQCTIQDRVPGGIDITPPYLLCGFIVIILLDVGDGVVSPLSSLYSIEPPPSQMDCTTT